MICHFVTFATQINFIIIIIDHKKGGWIPSKGQAHSFVKLQMFKSLHCSGFVIKNKSNAHVCFC